MGHDAVINLDLSNEPMLMISSLLRLQIEKEENGSEKTI